MYFRTPPPDTAPVLYYNGTPFVSVAWLLGTTAWTNCLDLQAFILSQPSFQDFPGQALVLSLHPILHWSGQLRSTAVHAFTTPNFFCSVQSAICKLYHSNRMTLNQYKVIPTTMAPPLQFLALQDHRAHTLQLHQTFASLPGLSLATVRA